MLKKTHEFFFFFLLTNYLRLAESIPNCRGSREGKVTSFTPFYVKRETASRRSPFHVNVMLNLSIARRAT